MKKQRKRLYSSEHLTAINHPLRISLLEFIKEGIKTTPELADALGENRINLYHHLNSLEKSGLIESYFEGDRVKRFRLAAKPANIKQTLSSNPIMSSNTLIISPSSENKKKFREKVEELVRLDGIAIEKSMDIIQVQIVIQPKATTELVQSSVKRMKSKR